MTRILLSILLATSSLSALSISISPKLGLAFITSGVANPAGATATIVGGYAGVNFSSWSIGINTALYSSDEDNYGEFISGAIKYNINRLVIGVELAEHYIKRSSFVGNCSGNINYDCSAYQLSNQEYVTDMPNFYIGYQLPITDNFTLIPSYETTFPFYTHLSSFTIYLDLELFK